MTTGRTFSTDQAAKYLGVAKETIRRAYRSKELEGVKNGLAAGHPLVFTQEALDRFRKGRLS